MEIEEIVKMVIFVLVLVVLVGGVVVLFSGQGGDMIDAIRNLLRFGR